MFRVGRSLFVERVSMIGDNIVKTYPHVKKSLSVEKNMVYYKQQIHTYSNRQLFYSFNFLVEDHLIFSGGAGSYLKC